MGVMAPTIAWLLNKLRKLEKTLDAKQQYEFVHAVLQYRSYMAEPALLQKRRFEHVDHTLLAKLIGKRSEKTLLKPM